MPYKDPERKHRWEQEHRQQRNARRRRQVLDARAGQSSIPRLVPYPFLARKLQENRKLVAEIIRQRKKRLAGRTARPRSRSETEQRLEGRGRNCWFRARGRDWNVSGAGRDGRVPRFWSWQAIRLILWIQADPYQ
jgi:hypothetical protein